jgi:shikimate 5-dehydrogenase
MITASTQLLAIVGTPIGLVRSPENFNRWFAQAGVDIAMFPADVDATGWALRRAGARHAQPARIHRHHAVQAGGRRHGR